MLLFDITKLVSVLSNSLLDTILFTIPVFLNKPELIVEFFMINLSIEA